MAVLIDASILIEAERGRLQLEPHVARRQDDESFLSVITASELFHGVHRAVEPRQRARRSAFASKAFWSASPSCRSISPRHAHTHRCGPFSALPAP